MYQPGNVRINLSQPAASPRRDMGMPGTAMLHWRLLMATHRPPWYLVRASLLLIALLASIAGGTAHAQRQAAPVSTLIVDWNVSDALTMDPGHAFQITNVPVDRAAYDTLVTIRGGDVGHVLPDLATSWQITGDDTVFTFKLRPDVTFASGNPLTADDVVFSYRRLQYLHDLPGTLAAPIQTIAALDPSTVRITLQAPDTAFLAALTGAAFSVLDSRLLLSKGATDTPDAAKTDKAQAYLDSTTAGSGPYILTEWTRNTRIVLTRNPRYWGPRPYFQQVILSGVSNPATQELDLRKGSADIAFNLTDDQAAALRGAPDVRVVTGLTFDYFFLAMNVSPAVSRPLSNPLVRQAVRYAIDYDGIVNKLLDGAAVQLASVIPIGYIGNSAADNAALRIKTDVRQARALLAQAGYPNGFSVTLTYPLNYSVDGVAFEPLATKIINDLKAVGITAMPNGEQPTVAIPAYIAGKPSMVLWSSGAAYPDAYDRLSLFGPGGRVARRSNYLQDGNLSALISKGFATANTAARVAIYKQVEEQLLRTGPYAVLVQPKYPIGLRADIKGFVYSPLGQLNFATLSR
jgi:peptide/nickel transport system substrate-binding protein